MNLSNTIMTKNRNKWIRENENNLISGQYEKKVGEKYVKTFYDARDLEIIHGTYQYEQRMLDYVRHGQTEELKKHLLDYAGNDDYNEGRVATDNLRQVKNIFIALVAMIGKMAAIPGGMPVEQAYHLIDIYSQQCEELNDIESIYKLQYDMVIDFSERTRSYQHSHELSPLVSDCINYIVYHLNEPISTKNVIEHSGMSRSLLSLRFKQETGYSIGRYINMAKVKEAMSLLKYTDKPISEIANYLAFSSQPHFHSVFKSISGMTPMFYRNQQHD